MNTWLISDTHFYHENILNFKTSAGVALRTFNDIHHMNEMMVLNWNAVVGYEDKVYHLGDVAMASFTRTKEIFDRLNGRKILIKGNHDNFKLVQYQQIFHDVRAYNILDGILLAHIPIHPDSLGRWKGQVHGHLHSNNVPDKRYFNVSVEQINYTPINFNMVKKYFDKLHSKEGT